MALLVLEILVLTSVEPKSVGFVRFEFHFENAGFLIGFVSRLAQRCSVSAFPWLDPTPRAVRHFFAEGHFVFAGSRQNIRAAGSRECLADNRRLGIYALLAAALQCRRCPKAYDCAESEYFCFVIIIPV